MQRPEGKMLSYASYCRLLPPSKVDWRAAPRHHVLTWGSRRLGAFHDEQVEMKEVELNQNCIARGTFY